MDLNIGLHSLRVAGLFVSKRRGGWIIELMPGMLWSKEERWVLEPTEPLEQDEEYQKDCLFSLEDAVAISIKISTDQQTEEQEEEKEALTTKNEDEEDEDEDDDELERECQACKKDSIDNICRVALQLDFPLPMDNRLGDHLIGRATFNGPFFLCKGCFLDFLQYYIENHLGRKEKTLKEDLNFIIDLLHNDEPIIGVERESIQRMLTTMARVYYPMLLWAQLKANNQEP